MSWGTAKPKKTGWYLVTLDNTNVMPLFRMEYPKGNLFWNGLCGDRDVVASVKFPKPYREENK